MRSRLARFTESDAKRLFKAAVKAGVDVRLEFRPDGTIIATSGSATAGANSEDVDTELDKWMKKHHADPT